MVYDTSGCSFAASAYMGCYAELSGANFFHGKGKRGLQQPDLHLVDACVKWVSNWRFCHLVFLQKIGMRTPQTRMLKFLRIDCAILTVGIEQSNSYPTTIQTVIKPTTMTNVFANLIREAAHFCYITKKKKILPHAQVPLFGTQFCL